MLELSKTKYVVNKLRFKSNKLNLLLKHKGILYVFGSNIISLIIGGFLSFSIPYFLDINNYGYYKQFTLYLSYVGLLHFGFNDGIYLEYGAYNYEELNKEKFRMYFRYLLFQQLLTSVILLLFIYILFKDQNRLFIFSFVLFNMISLNLAKYFSFISQVTKRFVLYSISYLIEKTALIIPLLFLFLVNFNTFKFVIISQTVVNFLLIMMFIFVYKELVFGIKEVQNIKEIKKILSIGISLMLGNFIIIMIFNIDRFMIDLLLPIKDFSIYSLAVQFLSIILVFVSSVSMFVYPYLKRKEISDYKTYYRKYSSLISILSILSLSLYFPIHYIITEFLPQYKESIIVFKILLPGIALRGEIDIVFNNIFKSLKKQKIFFIISLLVLLLSIILNITFYNIFKSIYAFSYASLITFIFWYLFSDIYLMKYFKIFSLNKYLCLIICFGIYYQLSKFHNILHGFLIYLFLVIILLLKNYYKDLKEILMRRKCEL